MSIPSIHIEGYRGIKRLTIPKLAQVNLIVGKNSVGKSSLLEAIKLYLHQGNPNIFLQTLVDRKELTSRLWRVMRDIGVRDSDLADYEVLDAIQGIKHSFFSRPDLTMENVDKFNIVITTKQDVIDDSLRIRLAPTNQIMEQIPLPFEGEIADWSIEIKHGDKRPFILSLIDLLSRRPLHAASTTKPSQKLILVPLTRFDSRERSAYWADISLTEAEQRVVDALNLVVPNISRLNLVDDKYVRENVAIAMVNGQRVTLESLGDGVSRMFDLALAVVSSQNGTLLVDEIDNGLHYTVQIKMWEFLMTIAHELNVQIFATTHSSDCVRAFQYVSNQLPDVEGQMIRLEKWGDEMTAIVIDEELMAFALDEDIEVR